MEILDDNNNINKEPTNTTPNNSGDKETIPPSQTNKIVKDLSIQQSKLKKIKNLLKTWSAHQRKNIIWGFIIVSALSVLIVNILQDKKITLSNLERADERLLIQRQRLLETQIKNEMSHSLEKMFGPNNFHVGVIAFFSLVNEKNKDISYNPNIVTINHEMYDSSHETAHPGHEKLLAIASQNNRQKIEENTINELPGIFQNINRLPQQSNLPQRINTTEPNTENTSLLDQATDIELPGFENINFQSLTTPYTSETTQAPQLMEEGIEETHDEKQSIHKLFQNPKKIVKTEKKKNKIIMNQTISISEQPKVKFENLYISVVINKTITDKFNIKEKDLSRFLEVMGGINQTRGDRFNLSIIPFREQVIDMRSAGIKTRKFFNNIPIWVYIPLFVMIPLGIFLKPPLLSLLKNKKAKKEEQEKVILLEKQLQEEKQIQEEKEWNEKRTEILEMAQKNPETMANILLDWTEQELSNKEETPETEKGD
ncbi:MAG: hypothetical protein VW378_03705 [bacterium]